MEHLPSFTDKDLKLKSPFGMTLWGPSSSGKSTFLLKLISQADYLIDPPPKDILYCFGEFNDYVPILQTSGIKVHAGVPTEELIKAQQKPLLLILDDLMISIPETYLSELFVAKSHHQNFSIIFVCQDPFFHKKMKQARQNSQYQIIMNSPAAALSVRTIGSQLFPKKLDYFLSAYRQCVEKPYGYIFIDCHASSHPLLRLRTHIFKEEELVIFVPKDAI